ncbi:unnamed protein product [Protopolystoma xenopodis]|uniref:Fibronectin type-III domain-containing protein n=1 Tax=Protopolystoma xenopodis TaxID=117903 RepID=A0A3S5ALJ0_9PLAT|nr:unnamed protein product [Protopolystoma xenopodis]
MHLVRHLIAQKLNPFFSPPHFHLPLPPSLPLYRPSTQLRLVSVLTPVPSQPYNFRAILSDSTRVRLVWDPPTVPVGSHLLDYRLTYRPTVGLPSDSASASARQAGPVRLGQSSDTGIEAGLTEAVETTGLNSEATQHLIEGLQPNTAYLFQLAGRTHNGFGVAAQCSAVTKTYGRWRE